MVHELDFHATDQLALAGGHLVINRETGRWIVAQPALADVLAKADGAGRFAALVEAGDIALSDLSPIYQSGLLSIDGRAYRPGHAAEQPPPQATLYVIDLTKACNLNCDYCYANAGGKSPAMSLDTATALFQAATRDATVPTIAFHGGEPLMAFKRLRQMVDLGHQIARQNGSDIRFSIQTNGCLLTPEVVAYLKANKISVGVSVDGFTPDHNACRKLRNGRSSVGMTLKGIENLLAAGVRFGLNTVVSRANVHALSNIVAHFARMGCTDIYFNPYSPSGRGAESADKNAISAEELLAAMISAVETSLRLRDEGHVIYVKNVSYIVLNMVSDHHLAMCQRAPCGAGRSVFGIEVDGGVFPCDDYNGQAAFKCGNVHTHTVAELRAKTTCGACALRRPDLPDGCAACPWKTICCGGCPSAAHYRYGDSNARSPWCAYYDGLIRYLFDRISTGLDPYDLVPPAFLKPGSGRAVA